MFVLQVGRLAQVLPCEVRLDLLLPFTLLIIARQHLKRTHVDPDTGMFRNCNGHESHLVSFNDLESNLNDMEKLRAYSTVKWRFTRRFLDRLPDSADVQSPCKRASPVNDQGCKADRIFKSSIQISHNA